jgi:hypothetical protein
MNFYIVIWLTIFQVNTLTILRACYKLCFEGSLILKELRGKSEFAADRHHFHYLLHSSGAKILCFYLLNLKTKQKN